MADAISKILLSLGLYKFLAYLEPIRSYAWLNGHSDPDLGSVGGSNGWTETAPLERIGLNDLQNIGWDSAVTPSSLQLRQP